VEEVLAASSALCELATAQAEFRRLDLDGNGVADFWTGDVAGFYRTGQIPFEVAAADLRPLHPVVKTPVPYRGYYFMALERDDSDGEDYRQDTDGRSGAVHHRSRFGFIVFPAGPGPIPYAYILNENNSMFRKRLEPGRKLPTAWPSDPELKNFWSRAG